MNIYGCLPSAFLSSPNPISYWAHAASIAGYPSTESVITSPNVGLNVKNVKSQVPLELTDVLFKKRGGGVAIIRDANVIGDSSSGSTFRVASRCLSPNGEPTPTASKGSPHLLHHHHHNVQSQNLHAHLQNVPQLYRKDCPSSPPLPVSGLTSLQALCDSDVSSFTSRRAAISKAVNGKCGNSEDSLKFGINRILSDDFGKANKDKENGCKRRASFPEPRATFALCPCSSPGCTAYSHSPHAVCSFNRNLYTSRAHHHHHHHLPSLSAVHALQPPNYPMSSSVDALPGPYSILSTEANTSNQPKRKRSWSRAVFSNLQRKGLEKRFEVQKYVTKPDRRQLAAMLGLTDAQVKVWFQNRRMKWRHAQQQGEKDGQTQEQEADDIEKKDTKSTDVAHTKSNQNDETMKSDANTFTPHQASPSSNYHVKDDPGTGKVPLLNTKPNCDVSREHNMLNSSPSPELILNVHSDESSESEGSRPGTSSNGFLGECPGKPHSNGTNVFTGFGMHSGEVTDTSTHFPDERSNFLRCRSNETSTSKDNDNVSYVTNSASLHHHTPNQIFVGESMERAECSSDEDSIQDGDSIMRDINVED